MSTRVNKKAIYARYLKGCEFFGWAPKYKYEDRTAAQFEQTVEWMLGKAKDQQMRERKAHTPAPSTTSKARNTANIVLQKAGETRKAVMERAKALKAKLPHVTVSVKWAE